METLFPDEWLKIAGSAIFFTSPGSAFARFRVRLPTMATVPNANKNVPPPANGRSHLATHPYTVIIAGGQKSSNVYNDSDGEIDEGRRYCKDSQYQVFPSWRVKKEKATNFARPIQRHSSVQ
jgi:hypothetical protein